MDERQVDRAVKRAFSRATPDVLDAVLSECGQKKGTVIVMTEKKKNSWGKRLGAMAAVMVLLFGIGFGAAAYQRGNAVAATVSLDVNPCIEIKVNSKERVLDVDALNEDADVVLKDMDLEGTDIDVAVNAIIGSMLKNGYISELANSILISVDSDNAAVAASLQEKLAKEVSARLNAETFSGAVLSQTVTHGTEVEKLAKENNITLGKAQLIAQIVKQDETRSFGELAKLSINELNLISASAKTPLENVTASGTASDKDYIGKQEAVNAAAAHVGATTDMITGLQLEMDYDDGAMIYEVEFTFGGFDYECDVDAKTGTVLATDKEIDDDSADSNGGNDKPQYSSLIGESAAMDAALQHARIEAERVVDFECELDDHGESCRYEITFVADGYEYEYEIDARTGVVLKAEKERDDDGVAAPETTVPPEVQVITGEAALTAALDHAGLVKEEIIGLEIELNKEDIGDGDDYGVPYYDIDFSCGGYSYDYDINALTGELLNVQIEGDGAPDATADDDDSDDFYDDDFDDDYDDDYGDGYDDDYEDDFEDDDVPYDE